MLEGKVRERGLDLPAALATIGLLDLLVGLELRPVQDVLDKRRLLD